MMVRLQQALRNAAYGAAFITTALAPSQAAAVTAQGQQELVDRATLAVQDVLGGADSGQPRDMLPHARAVLVCPRVFRASFLFGGEGGGCVLLARGGQGSWSSPAFYSMGGGSFGLQAFGGAGDDRRWCRGRNDDRTERGYRGICKNARLVRGRFVAGQCDVVRQRGG